MLANLAASGNPADIRHLLGSLWPAGIHDHVGLVGTAAEACDELGVVGLLLAAVGTLALRRRAPLVAVWFGFTLVTALLLGHSAASGGLHFEATRAGLPVALLAAAVPISAGAAELAARLGRARVVAAIVMAGLAVVSPVLDGGTGRWRRDAHGPERLLHEYEAKLQLAAYGLTVPEARVVALADGSSFVAYLRDKDKSTELVTLSLHCDVVAK